MIPSEFKYIKNVSNDWIIQMRSKHIFLKVNFIALLKFTFIYKITLSLFR